MPAASQYLLPLLCFVTTDVEAFVEGVQELSLRRVQSNKLEPVPDDCINGFLDPGFNAVECLPVFMNHMVVSVATPNITEELRRQKRDVSDETYYSIELYNVTELKNGATHENQLRVLPQNYTIHTVIDEPNQNQSAGAPQLTVRVVDDDLSVVRGRGFGAHQPPLTTKMGAGGIPGSDKFSFDMKVSEHLTLTRSYYRHVPQGGNIKGILIQYHGWSDTCESWETYSKTTAIADKYGLILITACGTNYGWFSTWAKHIHGWNAGTCCIQRQDIDDVEYTRIILQRENKNNLPVFGYGYSNGGMMVESLLCHKVIQKAVAVNAVLALYPGLQGSFKTCDNLYNNASLGPKPPVPRVASVHCIDDEVVPYNGSVLSPPLLHYFAQTVFPRTNRDIRRWASRIGCKKKETTQTRINDWTRLKEWKCPAEERAVSIKRSNCSHYGSAHAVVRTFDFDPAEWAAQFFLA
ncbi:hypothetical protein FOZ60_002998 [Perkinsus olseni]|uniref:Peptidase S9 prolyl oligopeptidase catalytic domain-containing protein n=1 Tax=Perkinsus olseni TaxID=32597 RepID=A0A7J6NWG1_PEROL|nr:hypothetical protein FOZ60_002998 [Perkinsus olseni]